MPVADLIDNPETACGAGLKIWLRSSNHEISGWRAQVSSTISAMRGAGQIPKKRRPPARSGYFDAAGVIWRHQGNGRGVRVPVNERWTACNGISKSASPQPAARRAHGRHIQPHRMVKVTAPAGSPRRPRPQKRGNRSGQMPDCSLCNAACAGFHGTGVMAAD